MICAVLLGREALYATVRSLLRIERLSLATVFECCFLDVTCFTVHDPGLCVIWCNNLFPCRRQFSTTMDTGAQRLEIPERGTCYLPIPGPCVFWDFRGHKNDNAAAPAPVNL